MPYNGVHLPGFLRVGLGLLLVLLLLPGLGGAPQAAAQTGPPFRVYLTFEDGPTDAYTTQLLDILAAYNARATFFPNGYQIAGREAILQRIVREGHAVGNHLWSEPGLYSGAPVDAVVASYVQTEEAVRAALGPDLVAVYDAQPKIFRQPGGGAQPFPANASFTVGDQVITGSSIYSYNWNVDSDDCGWMLNSTVNMDPQVLANVLGEPVSAGGPRWNAYQYGDGVIIVMHDINRVTPRVLPTILSELQSAGATFHALPRPEDAPGTMPVRLGVPPVWGAGTPGATLSARLTDHAWLREAPHTGAPLVITSLPPETPVTVTGRSGEWFQVRYEDQSGWMYAANLHVMGPIPALPVATAD